MPQSAQKPFQCWRTFSFEKSFDICAARNEISIAAFFLVSQLVKGSCSHGSAWMQMMINVHLGHLQLSADLAQILSFLPGLFFDWDALLK
jgi:hypothetical protein